MKKEPLSRAGRGLAVGLSLAFLLPWLVWSTAIAQQRGLIDWRVPQSLAFWVGLPVAYLAGAAVSSGRAGLADMISRLLRWRAGWRAWVASAGLAAGLPLVVWLGLAAAGAVTASSLAWQGAPVALLVETALFWLTEEALWRGFVLPRLEVRLTPRQAALVLGVVWALWHLPLFAIAGSFQSGLPYAGFFVLTVATSLILSWLYHSSGGSVPVCALFHGVIDVMFVVTGVLSVSPAAFWSVIGLHVAVAAVLWWREPLRPLAATA